MLVITRRRVEALGGRLTADLPSRDLVIAPHPLLTAAASFLRNAVDYRRPGEPPEVELKLRLEGGECVLTVRDRGVGISAVHLPRIWQAFYRIGEVPHPGDGVGLSIARVAVEGAGGTVQVRSDRRTGSIFEARLPGRAALDVSTP